MVAAALVVAIFAVLVALASALYARSQSVETRRARMDALGPRVTITTPTAEYQQWQFSGQGDTHRFPPGVINAGQQFRTPGQDQVRLLSGAQFTVVNEGDETVTIHVGAPRVDDATNEGDPNDPVYGSGDTLIPNGRFRLGPRAGRAILARSGPTLREWIDFGKQPIVVPISATASADGAVQQWELVLDADLLSATEYSSSTYEARHLYGTTAELRELPRHYED